MSPSLVVPRPWAVVKHCWVQVLEAFVVPMVLFYVISATSGVWWALIAGVAWAWFALLTRVVLRARVGGALIFSTVGLTFRLAVSGAMGSAQMYFLQPQVLTFLTGGVFLGSALLGRGVLERMAEDFCPFPEGFFDEEWVRRFFKEISLLWGGVNIANAGASVATLLTLGVHAYPVMKLVLTLGFTGVAIAVSVWQFKRHARREGVSLVWRSSVHEPIGEVLTGKIAEEIPAQRGSMSEVREHTPS